ncbi:MAG: STAS/SEC14 domain-containing protein, partial [Dysgonamonadaceae bacterium]|nr:STAS/SEC14 domain-containing protein [Dysgonamonadaceae bacterium]
MLTQIKQFKGNALALELTDTWTKEDQQFMAQLFEEKLNEGYEHINLLFKVKDMSIFKHMDLKAFMEGEIWSCKHFHQIGKCAVVAHSEFIKEVIKVEGKALHLLNKALEERYFDTEQLDE